MAKIRVDFRLLESRINISGLHEALNIMEDQLRFLSEQRKVQATADLEDLSRQGVAWDDPDVQFTLQERDHAVEHLYPRLFRGPFLMSLWAIYESGLMEVARFVKRNKGVELDIDEVRESNVRRMAKRYFKAVLQVDLGSDESRAGALGRLYNVRNAFAHANGRIATLRKGVRNSIKSMIKEGQLEESLGYIIPSKTYVASACDIVHIELSVLVGGRSPGTMSSKKSTNRPYNSYRRAPVKPLDIATVNPSRIRWLGTGVPRASSIQMRREQTHSEVAVSRLE